MSNESQNTEISTNGWAAMPRSFMQSLAEVDKDIHAKLSVPDVRLPDSDIAKKTYKFAKRELPERTFNHSMRVWYYGECHSPSQARESYFVIVGVQPSKA